MHQSITGFPNIVPTFEREREMDRYEERRNTQRERREKGARERGKSERGPLSILLRTVSPDKMRSIKSGT